MQSAAQSTGQDNMQGQTPQYSIPPAPTFASLGAHSMPFTGSLGSLASGHQQPPQQTVQGKKEEAAEASALSLRNQCSKKYLMNLANYILPQDLALRFRLEHI